MKRPPIQEILSADRKNAYGMIVWKLCLFGLLFAGFLSALMTSFETEVLQAVNTPYTIFGTVVSGMGGILCLAVAKITEKKYRVTGLLRLLPWGIVLVLTTPTAVARGLGAWINGIIRGWNQLHEGGVGLLSYQASVDDIRAFSFAIALLTAQLLWWAVVKYHMWLVVSEGLFWCLVTLMSGSFRSLPCGLLLAGMLGLAMTGRRKNLWKIRMVWTVAITAALVLCAFLTPEGDWQEVMDFRKNVRDRVEVFRYGTETLPQGDLYQADRLQSVSGEMLEVTSGQVKNLYLRNYTGGSYENGRFEPLSDKVYGGDNAGMLRWLSEQGFDPFTQVAQYYDLGAAEDRPEENQLKIDLIGANRRRLYAPVSLEGMLHGSIREKQDSALEGKSFRGLREYYMMELSGTRPYELTVTAQWVAEPENEAQQTYAEAEAVYRNFVYEEYTVIDSRMYDLMQQYFWEDYSSDSDGIYSALTQIRNCLRNSTYYTETPQMAPAEEDPIHYFLTQSHEGNAMLYAATAVEAFRAHGIPARYAEGYYIPERTLAESDDGTVSVLGEDAHAWVEVYFDGIGWLPLDVTPGYYYDAVKLQEMVAAPDMVHKTLAEDNNRLDAEQITDTEDDEQTVEEEIISNIRNIVAFRLGLLAVVLILVIMLITLAELLRLVYLWRENRRYDHRTPEGHAADMERKLMYYLSLRGIEAYLGWQTDEVDATLAERIPEVREGEYRRVCELLQKTIYGGIALEPYEERVVNYFLRKLYCAEPGSNLFYRMKLRYGILGYEGKILRQRLRAKKAKAEKQYS